MARATTEEEQHAKVIAEWEKLREQGQMRNAGTKGQWYDVPEGYQRGWVFMRCGRKGDPAAEELAYRLRRMAWLDAPVMVRNRRYLADGDRGLYMMTRQEVRADQLEEKRQRLNEKMTNARDSSMRRLASVAGSIPGASISRADVRTDTLRVSGDGVKSASGREK